MSLWFVDVSPFYFCGMKGVGEVVSPSRTLILSEYGLPFSIHSPGVVGGSGGTCGR